METICNCIFLCKTYLDKQQLFHDTSDYSDTTQVLHFKQEVLPFQPLQEFECNMLVEKPCSSSVSLTTFLRAAVLGKPFARGLITEDQEHSYHVPMVLVSIFLKA